MPADTAVGICYRIHHTGLCRSARRAVNAVCCSKRTGANGWSLRGLFAELEKDYPHIKETMLSAMGNVDTTRLLDPRLLGQLSAIQTPEPFPIL